MERFQGGWCHVLCRKMWGRCGAGDRHVTYTRLATRQFLVSWFEHMTLGASVHGLLLSLVCNLLYPTCLCRSLLLSNALVRELFLKGGTGRYAGGKTCAVTTILRVKAKRVLYSTQLPLAMIVSYSLFRWGASCVAIPVGV